MVRQLCPCSPWRSAGELRSTCSLGQLHNGAGQSALKEAMTSWTVHAGEGSWKVGKIKDLMLEQVCWDDLRPSPGWSSLFLKGCNPWKGPSAAVCDELQPMGRFQFRIKDCFLWEGTPGWNREKAWRGRATETK